MAETLNERVRAIFEGGGGEALEGTRFLPLVTLESEARCGLDASCVWVNVPNDGRKVARFEPANEHTLYEVLETKRSDFEERLAEGARTAGLAPDEVVLAFPAIAIVRAVLAKEHPYLTRLALQWLLPSELRELREDIVKVATSRDLPKPIKDIAERLIVPA